MSHPLSPLRLTPFMPATFRIATAPTMAIGLMAGMILINGQNVATAAPLRSSGAVRSAAPATLTFDITARFSYRDAEESSPDPEQVVNAKFALHGRRMRVESELAGRPLILIVNPPYAYRLLPSSKSGVRYRASALPNWSRQILGNNNLLPDPMSIRSALMREGARRIGTAKLNGVETDVYSASSFRGQKGLVKAWLRHSDALPLRFELKSKKLSAVASWRNYQRGKKLSASLFAVPPGYRVREGSQSS